MTSFTSLQLEILKIAKEKGFVTHEDFNRVYSSPISRKANLERFLALQVLNIDGVNFKLNSEKLTENEN